MAELSRRALITAGFAGIAAGFPSRASPPPRPAGCDRLADLIDKEIGGIARDPMDALARIRARLRAAAEAGLFDPWRGLTPAENAKLRLVDGGGPGERWKVQLFQIADGRSHPPHCHDDLASCLLVLDGRLRIREYDRLRDRETAEAAVLRRVVEDELQPGQSILTTEDHHNAHWFGAVRGPVLAVNFRASGYFRRDGTRLHNRRYLDPARDAGAPFPAPFIAPFEAKARFGRRPL